MTLSALSPLDAKLVRDWWTMRGQALAIALVLAAGIGMVIMSMGMIRSLSAARADYYADYRLADVFAPMVRAPREIVARAAAIPGVTSAAGRVTTGALVTIEGFAEPVSARVLSLPRGAAPAINAAALRSGRWPVEERADEIVVGEQFAAANRLSLGNRLRLNLYGRQLDVRIVGTAIAPEFVYALGPGQLFPDNRRFGTMWMAERPLAAALDLRGAVNEVLLRAEPGADLPTIAAAMDRLAEPYGGRGAYAREDLVSDRFLSNELQQLSTMAGILPPIFLAVAAFLIHMVMVRTIDAEREEIGLMMAFGFRWRTIGLHYAKLAVLLAAPGLLLGLVIGAWLGHGLSSIYRDFFVFPSLDFLMGPSSILAAALTALLAMSGGVAAALLRVRRLAPADAMRPPMPAQQVGWFTTLLARARSLDEPTRIILRGMARRPGRSLAGALGLGGAIGLYIASASSTDNSNRLIALLFDQSNRADMTVLFIEPRDERALFALARLPGVLKVEPIEALGARLGERGRTQPETLTAIAPHPDLYRLIDIDGRLIEPPAAGIALGAGLANNLGVAPGEPLAVAVTEGRRRHLSLPVQQLLKSPIGNPALVSRDTLARARLSAPLASGAYLAIDPDQRDALYRRLRSIPAIAGVTLRYAALQGIDDTIRETMGIVTLFNTGFAVLIITGVVINNSRITLAERARDLASLRVLGFRRSEAAYILLGELALLCLVAIPVGLMFGYGLARWLAARMGGELFILPFGLTPATMATSVLVMLGAAAVSSLFARRRLDSLDLVAVLKTWE